MIAAAVPLGAIAVALVVPLCAQQGRSGQLHIVKDCGLESGIPGKDFCLIVSSNLLELPAGAQIYYDLNAGPSGDPGYAGPGYFDQNIFVFVNPNQWAVGRCTGPNNIDKPGGLGGLCTLSDGFGPLAGFTARINVTHRPGGSELLFGWDGTYSFNSIAATAAVATPKNVTVMVREMQLDGAGSTSADGQPLQYLWSIPPGNPSAAIMQGNTAKPIVQFGMVRGDYTFQLTVTDSSGATATDTVTVRFMGI
jgi:hypothetical protein